MPKEELDEEVDEEWPIMIKIEKPLKPLTVKKGDRIELLVIIECNPKAKIYWFHEKRKIKQSRYVKIMEQVEKLSDDEEKVKGKFKIQSKLLIDEADWFDSGKYTVRAINKGGVRSSSVNINIKGNELWSWT